MKTNAYPYAQRQSLLFALVGLLCTTLVYGQQAPQPSATGRTGPTAAEVTVSPVGTGSASEEIIELSPFQVNAEQDTGYAATDTLGGTRLRTDLKDLAASISVITKELMDDLAADDMTRLSNYTMSTESTGLEGAYSGSSQTNSFTDFSGIMRQAQSPIRVRGLATVSRTRDYFLSDVPEDRYNIERIEVQRGPNGMLYGLGSPAGVINGVTLRANVQRNRTNIGTRIDQYGSYRASIDHNQVLIKDKLALRIAGVYGNTQYQVEEAYNINRRGYGTLTYKPFKDTTIRVRGEAGLSVGSPPQFRPPNDAFTYWWAAGKPVYNAVTRTFSFLGTPPSGTGFNGNPNQYLVDFQHRGNLPTYVVDAATGAIGIGAAAGHADAMELSTLRYTRNATNTGWVNTAIYATARADAFVRNTTNTIGTFANGFFRLPTVTDPSIFDFFHHQLDGTSRDLGLKFENYNFSVEQRLGKHAGIEIAYDRENSVNRHRDYVQFNRYLLNLDVTTVLADGTPNPNFGRLFMADGNFFGNFTNRREAFRATAYYDLDTKRFLRPDGLLAKILGRHTFTGNYTWQERAFKRVQGGPGLGMDYYNIWQSQNAGTSAIASHGQRGVNVLTYFGSSVAGLTGPQNLNILGLTDNAANLTTSGVQSITLNYHPIPPAATTTPTAYRIGTFNIEHPGEWDTDPTGTQGQKTKDDFRAVSVVTQSRWLENHVVSTVGFRRDWIKTYDAGPAVLSAEARMLTDDLNWPVQPRLDQVHDAFNWGVVLHAPKFITRYLPKGSEIGLLFNRSDNFTPEAERKNVVGASLDPTSGTTKDYGMFVSLMDRKIYLRLSHYKSASKSATNQTLTSSILGWDRTFFDVMANINQGLIHDLADGTDQRPREAAFIQFMQSPEATVFFNDNITGYHVDAAGNVIGNRDGTINRVFATSDYDAEGWELELTANPTKSWRITANVAKQEPRLSNSGDDYWAMLETWAPALENGLAGQLVRAGGTTTGTIRDTFVSTRATVARVRALDGSVSPEVRKWRFNVVSNYTFRSGLLKDWSVGAAYRWQEKAAIGYPVVNFAGAGVYDVTNPFYGPAEENVDAWVGYSRRIYNDKVRWRVQFNVRNIGINNKLIPVSAQPTGAVDTYRISASQAWTLSNSFDF